MATRCLDCRQLISRGSRCGPCGRREKQSRHNQDAYGGSGTRWEAIRRTVLERDGRCLHSTRGGCSGPLRVDHIVPVRDGGQAVLGNLRTLCLAHHRALETTKGGG